VCYTAKYFGWLTIDGQLHYAFSVIGSKNFGKDVIYMTEMPAIDDMALVDTEAPAIKLLEIR
jgi:hypothetical protein